MFLLQIHNGSTKNQRYQRGNKDKGNGRKRNEVMRRNGKRKGKKKTRTNASEFDRLALFPSHPTFLNYLPFCRQKTREHTVSGENRGYKTTRETVFADIFRLGLWRLQLLHYNFIGHYSYLHQKSIRADPKSHGFPTLDLICCQM